jgi:hypothetical protein
MGFGSPEIYPLWSLCARSTFVLTSERARDLFRTQSHSWAAFALLLVLNLASAPQPLACLFSDETLALYKKLTMIIGSLAQPLRLYLILQLILREKKERSVLSTPTSATATARGQDITVRDWRATRVGRILPRPDLCGSGLTSGLLELLTLYKVPLNASQFVPLPRCCTYLQHL